ncbi:Protein JLP2 [Ceratocystis fimbriata CBS 114723]|uniref:Protein JLP2 n=1 Tax=Ceratocystis fimbriata CBS 114723 TaxID=1035309 RepID=A0A2C5XCS6_9PEZI|nr:Protein JLP2 [Ceratocystis fimbriata CBS 114723]
MVYYFTSKVVDPPANIYVGKDKFESEFSEGPSHVGKVSRLTARHQRFHVDKLSSAHIYLRMNDGQTWDNLPAELVMDLAQLTKANSIEGKFLFRSFFWHLSLTLRSIASSGVRSPYTPGNKKDNITIIYTPWANLHKDGSMATGQVSFKDARKVRRILVPARENAIINRLNKTRIERLAPELDLAAEKDERLKELRRLDRIAAQARRKEELRLEKEYKEKKWQKEHAYDDLFSEEGMEASSNANRTEDWEDDFM